jgi:hypothetical protein
MIVINIQKIIIKRRKCTLEKDEDEKSDFVTYNIINHRKEEHLFTLIF